MRAGYAVLAVAAIATATWLTIETRANRLVLDHFDVVKPHILYRSGQLTPEQLDRVMKEHGIRTLVNFQLPGEPVETEARIAKANQADFLNLPMPGDGLGKEEQFREVLAAVDDPLRRPVLVHCARGTCRTGAAVALYRLERDGWTIEDVDAEMERQAYRDGRIAGYVYHMVRNVPDPDIYQPKVRHDRNIPPPPPETKPEPEPLQVLPPLRSTSVGGTAPEIQPIVEVPHGN